MHVSKNNNLALQKTAELQQTLFRKRLFIIILVLIAVAAFSAVIAVFGESRLDLIALVSVPAVCVCLLLIAWRKYSSATGKRSFSEFIYFLYDKTLLPLRFDEKYYLGTYPHVAEKIESGRYRNALEHYRIAGRKQSFSYAGPGGKYWRIAKDFTILLYDKTILPLRFDEKYYLRAYPHVALKIASGRYSSPIEHYRFAGRKQSFSCAGSGPVGRRLTVNDVPVAFFIFNRPALTQAVFEEIRAFAPRTLLVIADGARNENEKHLCEEARSIMRRIDWPCRVLHNFSSENLGCKERMSSGLKWVFEQVEEAIILEDDCLPDPTFFSFCSHLLHCYRDDVRVMQISGSCFLMQPCTEESYWFSRHSDIWGWATWRRAFRLYDVSMSSWPLGGRFYHPLLWRNPIERQYWTKKFDDTRTGEIDTWDYQWHWNVYQRNGRVIVPRTNLVTNLGFGAFATHTHLREALSANLATSPIYEISHPSRCLPQPQADFEVFCARYYFDGLHARREVSIPAFYGPTDFVVTHDLPVFAHGVGALIQKVFEGSRSWANIRSEDYHIRHKAPVPSVLIDCHFAHPNRVATMCEIAKSLGESRVRTVLAVPYSDQDCLNALSLSYLYGAPLRLWLMDDQNIHGTRISDPMMRELIEKSVCRLAICEEMRVLYEEKFGYQFEVQMPVERECDLIQRPLPAALNDPPKIVSCGNVWCAETMRSLMALTKTDRLTVDWYGNLGNGIPNEELSASGIRLQGSIAHGDLIASLRTYDLAIVAMPDETAPDRAWQARLSFPSKIVTLFATANLPILFIGPEANPGANFVRKNDLGETCNWTRDQFSDAVKRILTIERLTEIRRKAAALAGQFSASPVAERLWRGIRGYAPRV